MTVKSRVFSVLAIGLILLSIVMLERDRRGLAITDMAIGTTPATLYSRPDSTGPVVIIAHGFAGSRQLMNAYTLPLARAGYRVLSFDFEGHGRNPVPMSGDVTAIDGTTARLVSQARDVIAAARDLSQEAGPNSAAPVSVLGHSMATDVLIRAAKAEDEAGMPLAAIIAISMYSGAVTETFPDKLLIITGAYETRLREVAVEAAQMINSDATEGSIASDGDSIRSAVVAPGVEHVGVLFSATGITAAQDWLNTTYDRDSTATVHLAGLWVLGLLIGILLLFQPITRILPQGPRPPAVSTKAFWLAVTVPTLAVPVVLAPLYRNFLPVLVADYLMLHLALFGLLQLVLLRGWQAWSKPSLAATTALIFWGIAVFGIALDRYAASFLPVAERLPIIATLALGTIPAMIADSLMTSAGRGAWWRRLVARLALFVSLILAAVIDPEQLMFVLIVLPVFMLFFLVHGLLGRWTAQRAGASPAGIGLGICLAWALGVSFPLFAAG